MPQTDGRFDTPPPREKMFNAPIPVLAVALSMPVLYFFQERLPDMGLSLAFRPSDLQAGHWQGLLTSMLVHGGWSHVLMNAVATLAFGSPVARLFGDRYGSTVFLLFYIACGVAAGLGYGLVHWGSADPVVGASGAVFGLIGAATRLMFGQGGVAPLLDRRVIAACAAWMGVNLLAGVIGYAPGADGARIAWEAHAVGFVVGLLAIGPLGRAFCPKTGHGPGAGL